MEKLVAASVLALTLAACGSVTDGGDDDGACGDTQSDPANCGSCGRRCADLPGVDGEAVTCSDGECEVADACLDGLGDCDDMEESGCEADLSAPGTCGSCDVACGGAEPLCGADGESFACRADCSDSEMECSGTCADVADNAAHCGRCDRDCGGGACDGGQCQPVDVATERVGPVELAVSADDIYWSEAGPGFLDDQIATCPLPRCVLAPRLIIDGRERIGVLAVAGSDIYFVGCSGDSCDDQHRLYECPVAGCAAGVLPSASHPVGWMALAVGPTHLYALGATSAVGCVRSDCAATDVAWNLADFGGPPELVGFALGGDTLYVEGDTELRTCPEAVGCATPSVLGGSAPVNSPFRAHDGRFYWFVPGSPGIVRVETCEAASCTPDIFANDTDGASEIEVDDTGVYWLNVTEGWIRQCPLAGCTGAPAYLATDLTAPKALTLGDDFVYWIEGSDIRRVAKP